MGEKSTVRTVPQESIFEKEKVAKNFGFENVKLEQDDKTLLRGKLDDRLFLTYTAPTDDNKRRQFLSKTDSYAEPSKYIIKQILTSTVPPDAEQDIGQNKLLINIVPPSFKPPDNNDPKNVHQNKLLAVKVPPNQGHIYCGGKVTLTEQNKNLYVDVSPPENLVECNGQLSNIEKTVPTYRKHQKLTSNCEILSSEKLLRRKTPETPQKTRKHGGEGFKTPKCLTEKKTKKKVKLL